MFLGEWFWMVVDGFGCFQMALGGFRWFSVICSFSSYSETRCVKFKRTRQLWGVFVPKVSLEQMTKFLGNSTYFNIFQHISTIKHIVSLKLTYINLCKFSPFWFRFSPFWGNFFKNLFIWLIIGWQVCILGWEYDKYSYLLKPCCNYIFRVSIYTYQRR